MSTVTVVPVTIQINEDDFKGELIDKYIQNREAAPEFKSAMAQLVQHGSKEDKLIAAYKIKECAETGESFATIESQISKQVHDQGELKQIYRQYKQLRQTVHERVLVARGNLPNPLKIPYTPIPVYLKTKEGTDKIDSYISNRTSDPRETRGMGAKLLSMINNDSLTKTGKIRAAKLLKDCTQAGVPLERAFDLESGFSEGFLGVLFKEYEAEQTRLRIRMEAAVQKRKNTHREQVANSSPAKSSVSQQMRDKYAKKKLEDSK